MLRVLGLLAVGCGGRPTGAVPPIDNIHEAPPSSTALPCNATNVAELSPYAPRPPGTCTVEASTAFDHRAGEDRRTLFENGRPIESSSAPPYPRIVVFDARIPTPGGIRVGMTGADLERLHPDDEMTCTTTDDEWRGRLLCRLRGDTECAAEDANWFMLVFETRDAPTNASGAAARRLVRARRIIAIDLGPDCGES
jgi:hypothetical protein